MIIKSNNSTDLIERARKNTLCSKEKWKGRL